MLVGGADVIVVGIFLVIGKRMALVAGKSDFPPCKQEELNNYSKRSKRFYRILVVDMPRANS